MFNETEFIINCDGIIPINFNYIEKEKEIKKVKKEEEIIENKKNDVENVYLNNYNKIIYISIENYTYS